MNDIVIVPVGFFHWNKNSVIEKVSREIEQLDHEGALARLAQEDLGFHTLRQLETLLNKAGAANRKFKFTDVTTIFKLLDNINRLGDRFSPYNLNVLFAFFELSAAQLRDLFMVFPDLVERLPLETLQKHAAQSVLLAEYFLTKPNLTSKVLFGAKDVYQSLKEANHLSLWWFEHAYPYGLNTAVDLAFSAERYLEDNDLRDQLDADIQNKLAEEIQNREILERQIVASQEALDKLNWYQWRAMSKIKAQIKNAQINIITINNNILEICSKAGAGKNTIAQRALDVFLRRQTSVITQQQCWDNFLALKAIHPKYVELLDERHVEALFALADSPTKFLDVIKYLCYQRESREVFTRLLKHINIFSLRGSSLSLSQVAEAAANLSSQTSSSSVYESILPFSSESELHDSALQNIKRFVLDGTLIKEEDAPLGEAEWGDNFGAQYLSNYPQIAKAIYHRFPEELANDIKKYVRHPDAIIRFIAKNHRWLSFKHLVYISNVLTNPKARSMFLNLDFVKETLRQGVDDIIASHPITPDKHRLLFMALKQKNVREAVNLTRKRSRNEKLYNTNVVATWINHSLTGPDDRKRCNEDVAKIIVSDNKLLHQIRNPHEYDHREFKSNFILTNKYFDAAHAVYSAIESYSGWFSSGKDEFIQEFIADLKRYPVNSERCFIIANNPDLFQRLKDAYVGKQYLWGLFGPNEQTIKKRRAELKQLSEPFKEQLDQEEQQMKKGNSLVIDMLPISEYQPDRISRPSAHGHSESLTSPEKIERINSDAAVSATISFDREPITRLSSGSSIMTHTATKVDDRSAPARSASLSSTGSFNSSVLSAASQGGSNLKSNYDAHGFLPDKQSQTESPTVDAAKVAIVSVDDSAAVSAARGVNQI